MQGLIIENISNLYKIKSGNNIYEAVARGKFKNDNITPVVGDNVEIDITDEENKKAVIEKIIERKIYVKRPKIANITQMVFVLSSKDPKPDILMLDKQLAFAEFLGVKSIIVLNKIDLQTSKIDENQPCLKEVSDYIIKISALNQIGLEKLEQAILDMFQLDEINLDNEIVITNIRHKALIHQAIVDVKKAKDAIQKQIPLDMIAIFIKDILEDLGNITGDVVTEDIINEIFARFCLGK